MYVPFLLSLSPLSQSFTPPRFPDCVGTLLVRNRRRRHTSYQGGCTISPYPLNLTTDDGAHARTPFSDTDPMLHMTHVSDPLRHPLTDTDG